jgi:hypothetical protein
MLRTLLLRPRNFRNVSWTDYWPPRGFIAYTLERCQTDRCPCRRRHADRAIGGVCRSRQVGKSLLGPGGSAGPVSRFSQPSRSPDAWFASGPSPYPPPPAPRVEIVPAPNPYPPPPVLSGLKLSRRHREKPWSGSLDAGIGTVADMSGSAATTSSGLSGGIGKRDIGRGTAIAGDGLAATGSSKADQAGAPGERCAPA